MVKLFEAQGVLRGGLGGCEICWGHAFRVLGIDFGDRRRAGGMLLMCLGALGGLRGSFGGPGGFFGVLESHFGVSWDLLGGPLGILGGTGGRFGCLGDFL